MKKLVTLFLIFLCSSCVIEEHDISGPPYIIAPAPVPYIYRIYPNTGSPYYNPYFYHHTQYPKFPLVQPHPTNPKPHNPINQRQPEYHNSGNHTHGHR